MVLYDTIEQAIRQHKNNVIVGQATSHEVRNAIRWVMRNNPDIFWFAHQYHFDEETGVIQLYYTFSKERVESIRQSIDDVIQNDFCLDHVKTLKVHEQVSYVYKWLVTYCNYNANSAYNQNIYSVFVRRNSVCTGYAKAAQYLFNLLGIESRLVFGRLHNSRKDGRHCWNLVKIDDQFYHFDACLGDSILDEIAIKSGVKKLFKIDGINYNFLCVSTEDILITRSIEDIAVLPECTTSLSKDLLKSLVRIALKQREQIKGCLLSHIGSSADIYLCSKNKNTVLKIFRPSSKTTCLEEFHFMQQTKGCSHILQCNEQYTDIFQNLIAIEQSTPIVDLLCSHYYELSLKGLIKMATDVAIAWKECHDRGILYRDIHVCNIYRENDGTFKIGDLGSCTNDFEAKEIVGNQWFMSPETFVSGIFTESSAVYSISMVMFFIMNNLRPVFWEPDNEDMALQKRMNGCALPIPAGCVNLPSHIKMELTRFFRDASALLPRERINSIEKFIYSLAQLSYCCKDCDYIIHHNGTCLDLDIDSGNYDRIHAYQNYISRDGHNRYAVGNGTKNMCSPISHKSHNRKCANGHIYDSNIFGDKCPFCPHDYETGSINNADVSSINDAKSMLDCPPACCIRKTILQTDEVESFAQTMASPPSIRYKVVPSADGVESYASTTKDTTYRKVTYNSAIPTKVEHSPIVYTEVLTWKPRHILKRFVRACAKVFNKEKQKKCEERLRTAVSEVYSSIFAPAEVKRKSHLQVQVYLHLYEESEKIKSLAKESDKDAERRDYIPLSLKLMRGDKVDVEFNVYGETRMMSERKSVIWQGSFTKCSFDLFVHPNVDVDELSCEANLFVNGVMIGDMRFITQIVDNPRSLNPKILSHRFNRIFISYAHQDAPKIKFIALAYKAQGVDYFYDRDSLKPGDVYDEKIFDYIDRSDLFVLCWSKNAAVSKYVAKERGRALLRAYPQRSLKDATLKICPVSIDPRAELPSDMKDVYNFEII